jgi:hypothetical protein
VTAGTRITVADTAAAAVENGWSSAAFASGQRTPDKSCGTRGGGFVLKLKLKFEVEVEGAREEGSEVSEGGSLKPSSAFWHQPAAGAPTAWVGAAVQ